MNQEFYISVTPVRGDEYLVRTERVSPGVPLAEELVTWQVEEWLEQARQLMHDPLLGILRGRMRSLSQSTTGSDALSPNLVELGQKLYNALFQGTIRDSWVTAQGIAQNRREGLRLRLGLKGDRLPRLPWEVLHAGARPLATGTDVVFSRYQAAFAPMGTILQPHRSMTALDPNQPLRILMVLAAPTDQEVLELRREANHLRDELKRDGQTNGEIDLTILDQPGREQLTQALEQGQYQVLHYAGHSNLGMAGGDLYLVSDRTGLTEVLSGDDLAGLLVNNGIRMAVFNSCRGVYTATADPADETESSNLTDALLKRGIPAVLAMAERIPDDVALTLSRLFYRNLKQRYPIDLSLSRARQGLLSSYGSNQLYWALPILYLHPDFDGYLQPGALPQPVYSVQDQPLAAANFALDPNAITNDPADLDEAEMLFDDLEFADPEDSDRQAVLELLQELHDPADNPFSQSKPSEPFFEPLTATTDESQLQNAEDCLTVGRLRAQAEDLTGAVIAYGRAIELDSQCAEAFSEMGTVLEKLGSPTEAIVAYKMALQHEPSLSEARRHLRRLEAAHNLGGSAQGGSGQPPQIEAPVLHVEDVTIAEPMTNRIFGEMKKPPRRRPWVAAGILGTAVAAVLGVWGFSTWRASTTPSPSDLIDNISQINQAPGVNASRSSSLVALATSNFAQGDLRQGQAAIEELLNNGELVAADTAFQNVPTNKLDNPTVSFLRGRIAWQSVQARRRDYTVDDAQRYFETALRGNRSAQVLNALGFVYYAQGNTGRAGKVWLEAARFAAQAGAKQDERTALAGLALVANKTAQSQPGNQRDRLRREAVASRDRVLKEAPKEFQPNELGKNWLWNESAIRDWRALLAVK